MADSLGLKVTAERIEIDAQARLLRDWGCEAGQGYLLSRPLPAEAFARLLAASSASSASTRLREAETIL